MYIDPATIPGQRMYRTQSMDRRSSDGGFGALRRTLTDVAQEQALAREYSAHSQNAEAERIERAILDCSEVLQGPPQVYKNLLYCLKIDKYLRYSLLMENDMVE